MGGSEGRAHLRFSEIGVGEKVDKKTSIDFVGL